MFSEAFQIKYQGFHPSDFTESYVEEKLQKLYLESPRDCTLHAVFTRRARDLMAMVSIHSGGREFVARAKAHGLSEVSKKIEAQVKKQLSRWKNRRHGRHVLTDLATSHKV
jgi:ribosome-associated translation inhibitor RaiA